MMVNANHARKTLSECSSVLVVTIELTSCLVIPERLAQIPCQFATIPVIDSWLVESISVSRSVMKDHVRGVSSLRRNHADVEETK